MQDTFKKSTWAIIEGKITKFDSNGDASKYCKVSRPTFAEKRQRCTERGETKFLYQNITFYTYDPYDDFIPKRQKFIGLVTETLIRDNSRMKSKSLLPGLNCYMSGRRTY